MAGPGQPKTGGRQKGTPNKNKPFRAALDAVLATGGTDGKKVPSLEDIATVLLNIANAGNPQAIRELADRLDGKVPQMLGDADGNVLQSDTAAPEPASEAESGEKHERNGSAVRRGSRRR